MPLVISRVYAGTLRVMAMRKPITSSATPLAFAPGRLSTATPCSRVLSRLMLAGPLGPCGMSSSRGAASITRRETRLYERVTTICASPITAASASSVVAGRSTTSKRPSRVAAARKEGSTSAAMTNRFTALRIDSANVRRLLRKQKIALAALVVWHFVFFFPTLFMGRIVSPNDVYSNFDPWTIVHPLDVQSSVINDPPTSYYTLMSLLKERPGALHWHPFVAPGIPRFGSSPSARLSPLLSLPTLLLPLTWAYSGIIFLKLNVAFLFAYLWLREERLGKRGAAVGAIVVASAGALAVRFLWQVTNATTFYPALLWLAARVARGRRTPVWAVGLIALAYALSGFPATMAYGAYVALAYLLVRLALNRGRGRGGVIASSVLAGPAPRLALGTALPSPLPQIPFIHRGGYLGLRHRVSAPPFFPLP